MTEEELLEDINNAQEALNIDLEAIAKTHSYLTRDYQRLADAYKRYNEFLKNKQ